MDVEVRMERRRAHVRVQQYYSHKFSVPEGVHECRVLGLFQNSEDGY